MIKAIITHSKPAFYCKSCLNSSQILYIDDKKRYCSECVPEGVLKQAEYYNQNGEQIESEDI